MSDRVKGDVMRPVIDRSKCSGHGRCYTLAPDIFDCDDEGFVVLLQVEVRDAQSQGALLDAAANCPERAITLANP